MRDVNNDLTSDQTDARSNMFVFTLPAIIIDVQTASACDKVHKSTNPYK